MSGDNKYFQAFGLGFPEGTGKPPTLTAKGEYGLADQIVRLARRFNVPVVERPDVCQSLASVPLDSEIPEALYETAAALLVELDALAFRGDSGGHR
jgi:flagellar biosynthesis protein